MFLSIFFLLDALHRLLVAQFHSLLLMFLLAQARMFMLGLIYKLVRKASFTNVSNSVSGRYFLQRSYSSDLFNDVIDRISRHNIKPVSTVEQFKLLAEQVNSIWKENLRAEEICGEIPEEFQGGTFYQLF